MDIPIHLSMQHRIRFTCDAFAPDNRTFAELFGAPASVTKMAVVADSRVVSSRAKLEEEVQEYARHHANVPPFAAPLLPVPGGEECKNGTRVLDDLLTFFHDAGLCRHSCVVAVGGGAVLDAVGLAASLSHRGVRLIRFPTTTLSQGDSGVGVKNGINAFGKKNYLGVFSVPSAVVNDARFLDTLSDRDWRAGFSEAVKVALLKDPELFAGIVRDAGRISAREREAGLPVIRRSAELHLQHIACGGDPFELTEARPLDFGHWAAHKLEQLSGFRINHGEAVALGLALDVEYSWITGLLRRADAETIHGCLAGLGFALSDPLMARTDLLLEGLDEFREHLGGRLTVTLLRGIGKPVEVHEINRARMTEAAQRLVWRHPIRQAPDGMERASTPLKRERTPSGYEEASSSGEPQPDSRPRFS